MKVFRDICIAILLGAIGGFLVTVISYHNNNKEDGFLHTIQAVKESFNEVADAYAASENRDLLLGEETYEMDEETLAVWGEVEPEELQDMTQLVFGTLLSDYDMGGDVLVMDEADGNVEKGEPYSGIMRFHVRANSNSAEDQQLKMAVKEDIVAFLKPLLEECTSVAQSKQVLVSNMQNIYTVAMNTIVEQGYDYPVEVYVTEEEFAEKTYGDLTFPAGDYQALRVDIGEAKGHNWWGIMYPPLCFIDDTTSVVSPEGKEILQENLTPAEYAQLFMESDVRLECRLWNWLKGE